MQNLPIDSASGVFPEKTSHNVQTIAVVVSVDVASSYGFEDAARAFSCRRTNMFGTLVASIGPFGVTCVV